MSSFHLMAPRLYKNLNENNIFDPFWIKDILPRRGVLAGKYQLIKVHKESNFHEFDELISPKLINNEHQLYPSINASNSIEKDILELIKYSQYCHKLEVQSNWEKILPIYPTSPVEKNK